MVQRHIGYGLLVLGMGGCASSAAEPDLPGGQAPQSPGAGGSASNNLGSGGSYAASTGGSASPPISQGAGGGAGSASSSAGTGSFVPAPTPEDESAVDPGDRYDAPGTNPFVSTEYDPLSTFAADVDTASFDIFRRDIGLGSLPAKDSVRLEEYVNNFDYAYAPPTDESPYPFAIHLAAAPSLNGGGTQLLRVGIQGRPAPAERGPANLVFLVDVSGSMASVDKLPLVKVVLNEALNVLEPSDVVSIVTYAGSTEVLLPPTPVTEQASIRVIIEGLGAAGSTAGGAGIDLAYAQAEAGFIEGGINHVVLCTDGDFNVGLSSDEALLALIEERRKSGVTLTTLGFGSGNLNDSMMEKVSNAGNGMYAVISNADQAVEYANERLLSTMIHIAKDMKIQVEFNAGLVVAYRLLGYEDRAIADEDFRDDAVDAGEVGAGHRVTALYEIVPHDVAIPEPAGAPAIEDGDAYDGPVAIRENELVVVRVRYKQPGASESDEALEVSSALRAEDAAEDVEELDADFRWAYAIATFAEILKESPYADPEALPALEELLDEARGTAADRAEFRTLFGQAAPMLDAKTP